MTAEELKAGIRFAIEESIKTDRDNEDTWIDTVRGHVEFIDGGVDTERWAKAVHAYIVETLNHPFSEVIPTGRELD